MIDITAIAYTIMCREPILKLGMPRTKIQYYVHLTALLQRAPLLQSRSKKLDFSLISSKSLTKFFGSFGFSRCGIGNACNECRVSERKFSRGCEGRYRAPKSYWAPQALSGPMPLNHFLSNGRRSSFKSEGMTIFAYS